MTVDAVYESTEGAFAELVAHGVTTAVVSPGSRSTPLTIAAKWTDGLDVHIHLDERSAGFFALGIAKATSTPVVLVCTSGTAAANYLPAVVEAHYSGVPLIIFTADRPAELREWGAGQTIDQVGIYGRHVRWFAELAVAGETEPVWFRRMAARAVAEATSNRPGPVHLNWPLREPLEPVGRTRPSSAAAVELTRATPAVADSDLALLTSMAGYERGLIVSGPADHDAESVSAIADFAARTGWPIIAEPASQFRFGEHTGQAVVVATADQLLRVSGWATHHVPDVVIRIGDSPTCKPLRLWIESSPPANHVLIDPHRRWNEASFTATHIIASDPGALLADTPCDRGSSPWTRSWASAESEAAIAIGETLEAGPLLEAQIARTLAASLADGVALYVSNSMPVRDLDSFAAAARTGPTVYSNRGASGIDGLISCADGVAATGTPTVLYIGDIAMIHDTSGLLHAARSERPLTLVVPNNDGGGIFSFLPIADKISDEFDELFHTPHGTDLSNFGHFEGIRHQAVDDVTSFIAALGSAVPRAGVDIIEIPIDRNANVDQHRMLSAAVARTITT